MNSIKLMVLDNPKEFLNFVKNEVPSEFELGSIPIRGWYILRFVVIELMKVS